MSKAPPGVARDMDAFFGDFMIDELSIPIGQHAAALRRERPRLKLADAVILASAQFNQRILVTRNTKDFPASTPGVRVPYTF